MKKPIPNRLTSEDAVAVVVAALTALAALMALMVLMVLTMALTAVAGVAVSRCAGGGINQKMGLYTIDDGTQKDDTSS